VRRGVEAAVRVALRRVDQRRLVMQLRRRLP
jgi:hypothetical protein